MVVRDRAVQRQVDMHDRLPLGCTCHGSLQRERLGTVEGHHRGSTTALFMHDMPGPFCPAEPWGALDGALQAISR